MSKIITIITAIILILSFNISAQAKDKGKFVEPKDGFYQEMLKEIESFNSENKQMAKSFKLDFSNLKLPKFLDEFKYYWFNEPISQGQTGTCWSFCTTSLFESEFFRIHIKKVKLSEMFTAYWDYVEKARRFIKERGNSVFGEGSQPIAVVRIRKKYGIVPMFAYSGLLSNQKIHDHSRMYEEMNNYLKSCKQNNIWNEEEVTSNIKSILNHYIGESPSNFEYEGKNYTPQSVLKEYLKLNLDDYFDLISILQQPYWEKVEYEVPDNWWHNKDYYNVPLDDFMDAIKNAIKNGYTLVISGDVSEAGYDS